MPIQILIVEDELIIATNLEETLLNAGYGISGIARTYAEAREIARHKAVDVALVDVRLATAPDGIATARELLRIKKIPIIYLTDNTDKKP